MTTLTLLKAEIADDLASGSAFTTVIAAEITRAIEFYSKKKFYFNESRDKTFITVQSQIWYSNSDDTNIPLFLGFNSIHLEKTGDDDIELVYMRPSDLELLTDSNSSENRPTSYTYLNQSIGVYPIPDGVYTVRMTGFYQYPAPATDGEADNPWMTKAYNLIRARTLHNIYKFKMRDHENAQASKLLELEELGGIEEETARRIATNRVKAVYL